KPGANHRPAGHGHGGFQLGPFQPAPRGPGGKQGNRPKHQAQNPDRAAKGDDVERQPMTPRTGITQEIEPAVRDEKWRQGQWQNRRTQDANSPAFAQSRQPERRDETKTPRQKRCQAADQQAVFEQEPIHLKKISFNFAVVLSKSSSNFCQSAFIVTVETSATERPSNALAATSRSITSRRCRYSNRRCAASAWGARRVTATVLGIKSVSSLIGQAETGKPSRRPSAMSSESVRPIQASPLATI